MAGFVAEFGVLWGTLLAVAQVLAVMVMLLLTLAFILLFDRKVWAAVQMRKGPNVVGPFGLLQSFADFFKFVFKEIVIPAGANKTVFILAPLMTLVLAFAAWAVVPIAPGWVISDLNVGILYLFAISSLGVYGIIMGGWASNSKYPFLGSLRSAAQMVSYEVSIGFVIITVLLLVGSMNLTAIVSNQADGVWAWHAFAWPTVFVMFPMFVIFFISALAETNRPPFDLPEAESELVAGYQVEYSSTPYLLFMIGEYLNIVLMCAMIAILFLGGWHPPWGPIESAPLPGWAVPIAGFLVLYAKIWFVFFLFAMVKAIVPRYRYDQLMRLGWKVFLPTALAAVIAVGAYRVHEVAAARAAPAAIMEMTGG
ncbi:MAG: NADH-quinone oxidoreductase subunit NuoH [Alphaproteobacteria bacterium]|jgi:NADH-quinone oxidoreductase subunit H|nr:NADH-quinone oxidoreductase subunit NuoH [Alphaproteobacteria bacterium]